MPIRVLSRRLTKITNLITSPVDQSFLAFAAEVIRFGGHEPSPEAVERLARWYAGDYRKPHEQITLPGPGD